MVKKKINKELVMTKKDNEDFEKPTKSWICDNAYFDGDVNKVRDNCHINGKYRGSAHKDCNINVKFQNLKNMIHILLCKNWANSMLK